MDISDGDEKDGTPVSDIRPGGDTFIEVRVQAVRYPTMVPGSRLSPRFHQHWWRSCCLCGQADSNTFRPEKLWRRIKADAVHLVRTMSDAITDACVCSSLALTCMAARADRAYCALQMPNGEHPRSRVAALTSHAMQDRMEHWLLHSYHTRTFHGPMRHRSPS